jgi:chemotaxis protein histidine kinase CheA
MTTAWESQLGTPRPPKRRRGKALVAALSITLVGWSAVGCSPDSELSSAGNKVSAPVTSTTEAPPVTISRAAAAAAEAEVARAAEAEVILTDRETALFFIGVDGGCEGGNIERCIANYVAYLMPESPALAPALELADDLDRQAIDKEERRVRESVEAAEKAENERLTAEFVEAAKYAQAVQAAEKAENERLTAEFVKAAKYAQAVQAAEKAEAEARRIGKNLVAELCFGNGGTYQYWTNPPRAVVTSCYRSNQTSNGGRTGAICNDGWSSSATGRGACSSHGGVRYWTY